MRVFTVAMMLLVSSSLYPLRAQEAVKPPPTTQQTMPAQPDRTPAAERDRPRVDDREVNREGRIHRGDGGLQGDREMGSGRRMQRDRDDYRDSDKDLGRYGDRDDRSSRRSDRADQDHAYGDAREYDGPRHRVKVCIEYDNGDEYCRYRRR